MSSEIPIVVLDHDPKPEVDYIGETASTVQPEMNIKLNVDQKRPGRIKRGLRRTAFAAGALVLSAGALQIYDWVQDFNEFGVDATKKVDVSAGPATSTIRTNQFVNLAEVTSEFPLVVKTSLDRIGPSNCDMKIVMKNEGEQVKTVTNTGVVFSSIETVKNDDGTYKLSVTGDMVVPPSSVKWNETPILFERDLPMFDACLNMDEPNQAMDIAVTTTLEAGQVATACAIDSPEGELAIYEGLKEDAKMHGNIPPEVTNDKIIVEFDNLNEQQDALYGRVIKQFDEVVGAKLNQYIDATDDHVLNTNFEGIKDCEQHKFIFAEDK